MKPIKTVLISLFFLAFFSSCSYIKEKAQEYVDKGIEYVKEEFRRIDFWFDVYDTIRDKAKEDLWTSMHLADQYIRMDTVWLANDTARIYYIKGLTLMEYEEYDSAITQFTLTEQYFDYETPAVLARRAGCYLKLNRMDEAVEDLDQAAREKDEFLWHKGNYFEMMGEKQKAIDCYQKVFASDTSAHYCQDRIHELTVKNEKFYDEINYRSRTVLY